MDSVLESMDPRLLGKRLQEARKARGLTQQEAAEALGMARTTLTAVEKGERRIQPREMVELARLYGRQVSDLVGPREPIEGFALQFRTAIAQAGPQQTDLERALLEFQGLCEDYRRLERLCGVPLARTYPPQYRIDDLSPEDAAEDVATAERNRLGLGDGPVMRLREALEGDVGLRIFSVALPSRVAGAYGYVEDLGGCVAVNAVHPEERRRWTLAHEYGHFLTSRFRPEIALLAAYERVPAHERFADAFAASFLMPAAGLRRRANEVSRGRGGQMTASDLCVLAHYYFVSVQGLTLRLEDLRLLPRGTWDRLRDRGFKVREAQEILGLSPHPTTDQRLPLRYQLLALEAYEKGDLTEGELAGLLRVDRLEARRLAQDLLRPADVSEEGEVRALPMELGRALRESGS